MPIKIPRRKPYAGIETNGNQADSSSPRRSENSSSDDDELVDVLDANLNRAVRNVIVITNLSADHAYLPLSLVELAGIRSEIGMDGAADRR